EVEAEPFELGAGVGGGLRRGDAVALGEQEAGEQIADATVVVDHQQVGRVVGERGGYRGHGPHPGFGTVPCQPRGRRARSARAMNRCTESRWSPLIMAVRNRHAISWACGPSSASACAMRAVCSPASFIASASPFGVT